MSREQLDRVVEHAIRHDGYVGGWRNGDNGLYYFDSTRLFPEDALFPCDQFGHQAPGSDDEIHAFCALKYNTSFDQLAKIEVNGPGADPIYVFLKAARPKDDATDEAIAGLRNLLKKHNLAGAEAPGDIEWNFTKFLVDRDGNVVKRFHPTTAPETIDAEIAKLL